MSLIGVHIGTTGCTVIAYTADGSILGRSSRSYSILSYQPGWAEQEAERVWQMVWESLEDALAMAGRGDPPKAMALSVENEAVILLDRSGYTLRYAILGMDRRASGEWPNGQSGEETPITRSGRSSSPHADLAKFIWLKKNEPEVWKDVGQFASYEDFFLRRFCGTASMSHSLASRTRLYDFAKGDWADDILEACGIDRSKLASLAPAGGGVVGGLRAQLAHELGIHHEMPVVSGGYGMACTALGCGAIQAGSVLIAPHAKEPFIAVVERGELLPSLRERNFAVYRHAMPGSYLVAAPAGETSENVPESFERSIRNNLECLRENGIPIRELILADNEWKNESWLPQTADTYKTPVRSAEMADTACLGAALLAGTGAGVYGNPNEAVRRVVKLTDLSG